MNKFLISITLILIVSVVLFSWIPERTIDLDGEEIITLSNLAEIEEAPSRDEYGVITYGMDLYDNTVILEEILEYK